MNTSNRSYLFYHCLQVKCGRKEFSSSCCNRLQHWRWVCGVLSEWPAKWTHIFMNSSKFNMKQIVSICGIIWSHEAVVIMRTKLFAMESIICSRISILQPYREGRPAEKVRSSRRRLFPEGHQIKMIRARNLLVSNPFLERCHPTILAEDSLMLRDILNDDTPIWKNVRFFHYKSHCRILSGFPSMNRVTDREVCLTSKIFKSL